jgi:hypothetical protein
MVPLSKLMAWPGNPKEHDLDTLGESFERFGFVEPIIFDEGTKKIVAGHGRREKLLAWKNSGKPAPDRIVVQGKDWLVPVLRGVTFANAHEAEAYLLASNQSVINGGYNAAALAEMLARHSEDASGIGWKADEIEEMVRKVSKLTKDFEEAGKSALDSLAGKRDVPLATGFAVVVECSDEQEQLNVIAICESQGWKCRALM